jgi:hypothetical protein
MKFISSSTLLLLVIVPTVTAFAPSRQATLLQRNAHSIESMTKLAVAADIDIINGEAKPRRTREVRNPTTQLYFFIN